MGNLRAQNEIMRRIAYNHLQSLVGQPLQYSLKSVDTNLYDFGFGDCQEIVDACGRIKKSATYILHITCNFQIIWQNTSHRLDEFFDDTSPEKLHSEMHCLHGRSVKRVALSDKNDLWLDLGVCWIVFATRENEKESWRFFFQDRTKPHIIVSNSWVCVDTPSS